MNCVMRYVFSLCLNRWERTHTPARGRSRDQILINPKRYGLVHARLGYTLLKFIIIIIIIIIIIVIII